MRVAIIGAGAMGCAVARFLAAEGCDVRLLERFEADHDFGSSFGSSRIIRRAYPDRFYAGLMNAAYPLWEELERDAGETLLLRTGGLFFGSEGSSEIVAILDALTANGVPYRALDSAEIRNRFPAFRMRPDEIAVWQEDGGILRASACVRAQIRIAVEKGAILRERSPVLRIETSPSSLRLHLANGEEVTADRLIVAAGPWLRSLMPSRLDIPLLVTRQTYCHFEPARNAQAFEIGAFPIWIDFGANFYGFPHQPEISGVKIASHDRGEATDADHVDRSLRDEDRELLRRYRAERLPDLSESITYEKVCLYSNTPDEDFILDRSPDDARVIFMGGGSGHAFKFSILLGRIAADLTLDRPSHFDLRRFGLARFNASS